MAETSAEIAATAPALMVSTSQDEDSPVQAGLEERTEELIALTVTSRRWCPAGADRRLADIEARSPRG